jgi:DNA-binding NarL/FixJ family response regulator
MAVNPKSLNNLVPGGNRKNAVRVTLTLKPETVELLRMTGNMSQAVDKFIELVKQGCVQHDGMLNPLPRSEPEKLESQNVYSTSDATAFLQLSPRELEVLKLVAEGKSNPEIAATLYLSAATIKTYVCHIMTKMAVDNRVQAVVVALRTGLV